MRTLRSLPLLLTAAALVAQAPKKGEAPKPAPAPAKPAAAPAPKQVDAKSVKTAKKSHKMRGSQGSPESIANELNARFAKAMEAGDSAAVAAIYTENAELHMSAQDVYKGRDGIKAFADGFLKATPVKSAKVTSTAAHRLGNTITDVGTFTFILDDKGQTKTMTGTYAQLLWHDKDGQWRLHKDFPLMAK
jgi:uncharacterized protein (TIGR02246 family)